jgi:cyclohexa-1,5-dienecarbonyl-CoA hydratase
MVNRLSFKNILLEKKDGVVEITINRPPLNILDIETLRELNKALKNIKKDDAIGLVVLKGAGSRAFSAGVDIKDHMPERVEELLEIFHSVFYSLFDLDRPTIAVVDGYALGGGCEVAVACDVVIASEGSVFGQPEISAGVLPPPAAVLFPKLTGRRKAFELILTGDRIDAKEAERIGLINKAVPAEKLNETVDALICKLKEKSPIVLRLNRKAIYSGLDMDFNEGLKNVTALYLDKLMKTEDAVEGLKAFLEKRKPIWKGR